MLEKKTGGGGLGNVLEKKTGGSSGGSFGKLLENKKGGAGGGSTSPIEKKIGGFGNILDKKIGNAVEKKGTGFGNILEKKGGGSSAAFGKMSLGAFGKRGTALKSQQKEDEHGILEGISSLHSWIKSQTMIKPNQKMKGKHGAMYDEVIKIILYNNLFNTFSV